MKKKIMLDFMLVITVCVVALTLLFAAVTYNLFDQRVSEMLELNARTLASLLESGAQRDAVLAPVTGELRVTVVAPDGTVEYDSEADASEMDNHAQREEILGAMENGQGRARRSSETLGMSTYYFAVRMDSCEVLRVAKEAGNVWSLYLNAVPFVLLVLVGMLALSFVLANLLTRRILQPIEQMTAHLDSVSGIARYPELEPFMDMIQSQHEEILKSANMRVEFTANVSHELKTPLTSISGYAELIESGMATGEQVGHFAGEIREPPADADQRHHPPVPDGLPGAGAAPGAGRSGCGGGDDGGAAEHERGEDERDAHAGHAARLGQRGPADDGGAALQPLRQRDPLQCAWGQRARGGTSGEGAGDRLRAGHGHWHLEGEPGARV